MSAEPRVVESRSFDFVPEVERTGTLSGQFRFWFMVNATLITAFTGAVGPLFGLGLPMTVAAIIVGTIFGTLFQAFHGAQGPHMGLPQMIQSRVQFGSRGAIVPIAVATIVPLGFSIFYFQSGASAFTALVPGPLQPAEVVIGALAMLLAIVGYRLILRSQGVIAFVMLANLIALTVAAVVVLPVGKLLENSSGSVVGFLAQFGAAAIYQIAIAPIVSDYTRYLPTKTRSAAVSSAVFIGTVLSALWIEILGAGVTLTFPKLDVVSGIRQMGDEFGFGLGAITMVVSIVVCLVTASVSLYSGSISFLSALEAFRPLESSARLRTVTLLIAGTVVVVTGLLLPTDILNTFSVFLTLLGYLLIPWTAVNLTDYYLIRRGRYSISDLLRSDGGVYGRWNARGLISYTVGFLAMVPFFSTSIFTGPIAAALGGADISFGVGLIVASVVYAILMRSFDLPAELKTVSTAAVNTLEQHDAKEIAHA